MAFMGTVGPLLKRTFRDSDKLLRELSAAELTELGRGNSPLRESPVSALRYTFPLALGEP